MRTHRKRQYRKAVKLYDKYRECVGTMEMMAEVLGSFSPQARMLRLLSERASLLGYCRTKREAIEKFKAFTEWLDNEYYAGYELTEV
ncbi:hypothetical protein NZ47_11475 [Anaerovibrio lipolyticus]|uniref:Uncharacterized protein n=1 Tax=Anaerovibrio lipolyticus TaxID=82374 RepID=A0A0B2JSI8_9FIRM|nr:hypothetical protein [Anaerovibrio lipolyticus]KHM51275.1 hypothetical protein NZ47_11475 [Anaerovibrio lipolyticus]